MRFSNTMIQEGITRQYLLWLFNKENLHSNPLKKYMELNPKYAIILYLSTIREFVTKTKLS